MASIYKKKYPIPIPNGAEIITRQGKKLARWKNGKGQLRTAKLLDKKRIQFISDCWYIRYNDVDGKMRRVTTGCRDKQSAQKMLADILSEIEKVKAGVMSQEEMVTANQLEIPLDKHLKDYITQLAVKTIRGRRISPTHVRNVRNFLNRLAKECNWLRLKDINRQVIHRWMIKLAQTPRKPNAPNSKPLAARTINMHRASIVAFCNWCISEGRLQINPLNRLPKIEEVEPMRKRRPLTEEEIARLLKVAKVRPLQEALTICRGKNKGKLLANVSLKERQKLERLGQERSLIYKFMILTGLRRGEVASLTVSSIYLDEANPCIHIEGKYAKSGRSATLPLRPDLADDLRKHLMQMAEINCGEVAPDTPLFNVGQNSLRVFNMDLAAAGIVKCDANGRTVDVHSLRHTFATLLARNGVSPGIAQKLMRHSDIRLTMNTYTHLDLADTAGAVASLPAI